jgi:hypothetical protein
MFICLLLRYRVKKAQYIFYKHVLLHGLNISLAMHGSLDGDQLGIPHAPFFRLYWVLLNAAYVLEFFLQVLPFFFGHVCVLSEF